jgi:hypothetical protein
MGGGVLAGAGAASLCAGLLMRNPGGFMLGGGGGGGGETKEGLGYFSIRMALPFSVPSRPHKGQLT